MIQLCPAISGNSYGWKRWSKPWPVHPCIWEIFSPTKYLGGQSPLPIFRHIPHAMASMVMKDIWDLRLLELLWIGVEDGSPESPQPTTADVFRVEENEDNVQIKGRQRALTAKVKAQPRCQDMSRLNKSPTLNTIFTKVLSIKLFELDPIVLVVDHRPLVAMAQDLMSA